MNRPPVVNRALKLLYFSLALGFINIFVSYSDSMNSPEFQSALPMLSSIGNPATFFIGLGLLFWLSYVFLAWLLSQGRRGARIFLLLSVIFSLFGAFTDLVGFKPTLGVMLSLAMTALQTYSCYLFYREESTAWLKARQTKSII